MNLTLSRKWESFDRKKKLDKYRGGTLFCDGPTSYIHINHQASLRAGDTLYGKHSFKQFASSVGIDIQEYCADNHIFNAKAFLDDCEARNQQIDFCGVGAHFQNAAERAIQTVTT